MCLVTLVLCELTVQGASRQADDPACGNLSHLYSMCPCISQVTCQHVHCPSRSVFAAGAFSRQRKRWEDSIKEWTGLE